ncbi:MAG: hypothetical protein EA370_16670 [Wenzhouxiangella sp.]|nr:MAG: hypothetical protein EA370_16670 [Wenzhouxiangella sp.]
MDEFTSSWWLILQASCVLGRAQASGSIALNMAVLVFFRAIPNRSSMAVGSRFPVSGFRFPVSGKR